MKIIEKNKLICLIGLIIFLTNFIPVFAQWEKLTNIPSPYNNGYWLDVFFLESNPDYGWVCGYNGWVLRTTDRGKTWRGTTISSAYQLESVHFVNEKIGYTSGDASIYKSTDGGVTWSNVRDSRADNLWGNFFVDKNYGVVVGGGCWNNPGQPYSQQFYRTTNGGVSWSLFEGHADSSGMTDVILYEDGRGFASSSGMIWRTLDSAKTWSIYAVSGAKDWQEELSIFGSTFLVPYSEECSGGYPGGMRSSRDNGASWTQFFSGDAMFGVFLQDSLRGWACGWNQAMWYTSNAGLTWVLKNCGMEVPDSLDDIWFIDDTTGFVVGSGIYRYCKLVSKPPKLLYRDTTTICEGDSVFLYTFEDYNYFNWSTGEYSEGIIVKESGKYFVVVNNSVCDSTRSDTIEITVNPAPKIEILTNKTPEICEGDSVILYASQIYDEMKWSTGESGDSITVKKSGNYSLIVTNSYGCSKTASINVKVNPLPHPKITVSGRPNACAGDSAVLSIDGNYSAVDWYLDNDGNLVASSTNRIVARKSGQYYVKVVSAQNCPGTSDTVSVSFRPDSNRLKIEYVAIDNEFVIDSTILSVKNCKGLKITNIGGDVYYLNEAYLYQNINFSIPLSQFTMVFLPNETKQLIICYSPSILAAERDTLLIDDNCGQHYVYLKSFGKANVYEGLSNCDVPIILKSKKMAGDYIFTSGKPYPNPATKSLKIAYQKSYPENDSYNINCSMYNVLGVKVLDGARETQSANTKNNSIIEKGFYYFNTSNIPDGLYFVRFSSDEESSGVMVIIEK